jgi:hypothetical protein
MKTTIISLILVLIAVGCSKKESANAPIRFAMTRGDVALAEITTNNYQGHDYYSVRIKPTSDKEAELYKFSQRYPNREIEVVVDSTPYVKIQMPASALKPPLELQVQCGSLDNAKVVERGLKELSQ